MALGALLAASPPVRAASVTLLLDNDSFADTDHHYTGGQEWVVAGEGPGVPPGLIQFARNLPFADPTGGVEVFLCLGQNVFTPDDIERPVPPTDERPYAGWLYLVGGLAVEGETHWDQWDLTLGVVGRWALAEEVQIRVHAWTDSRYPAGWDYQLQNEPGVILGYRRGWRVASRTTDGNWGLDLLPVVGLEFGNVFTNASGGFTFRAGRYLDAHRGPARIRPRVNGSAHYRAPRGLGIHALLGLEGRLVARNIFLDGNTFVESASVGRRWTVGTVEMGLVMLIRHVALSYTHVLLSPEYQGQKGGDDYGALSLGVGW